MRTLPPWLAPLRLMYQQRPILHLVLARSELSTAAVLTPTIIKEKGPLFHASAPFPTRSSRAIINGNRENLTGRFPERRVAGLEPPAAKIESDSISFIGAVLRNSDMLSFATSQVLRSEMGSVAPLFIPGLAMTRSAGILYRSSAGVTPASRLILPNLVS